MATEQPRTTNQPRRRNAAATQIRILDAAQQAFAETGYSHTGIRDIAAIAGTSSTLLLRYFGSKAGLFEAALKAAMPVNDTLLWGKPEFAGQLADSLMKEDNPIRPPLMIALASGDAEAAEIAARVTEENAITPLAEWLGGENARGRALAITMAAMGFATYLRQLPLREMRAEEYEFQRQWFTTAVQRLVDGQT